MHVAVGFTPAFKYRQKILSWWLNAGIKPTATSPLEISAKTQVGYPRDGASAVSLVLSTSGFMLRHPLCEENNHARLEKPGAGCRQRSASPTRVSPRRCRAGGSDDGLHASTIRVGPAA